MSDRAANGIDKVRERLARTLHETHKKNCVRMFEWKLDKTSWDALDTDTKRHYYSAVNEVFSDPDIKALLEIAEKTRDKCPECSGNGFVTDRVGMDTEEDRDCPNCLGSGRVGEWHLERLQIGE